MPRCPGGAAHRREEVDVFALNCSLAILLHISLLRNLREFCCSTKCIFKSWDLRLQEFDIYDRNTKHQETEDKCWDSGRGPGAGGTMASGCHKTMV